MTTIQADRPIFTLINVFTVEPNRQAELLALLEKVTDEIMCYLPGFISANLHRSLDGRRVVNYAQWQSREDWERMLQNPEALAHIKICEEMATRDGVLCEVTSVHASALAKSAT